MLLFHFGEEKRKLWGNFQLSTINEGKKEKRRKERKKLELPFN